MSGVESMVGKSGIEWCGETWEVTAGCSHVSSGCANCYAETLVAGRLCGSAARRARDGKGMGKIARRWMCRWRSSITNASGGTGPSVSWG